MQQIKTRFNQRNVMDLSMLLIAVIVGVNPAGWAWSAFVLFSYFTGRFVSHWPDES